jgi:hypothetical protein
MILIYLNLFHNKTALEIALFVLPRLITPYYPINWAKIVSKLYLQDKILEYQIKIFDILKKNSISLILICSG